MNILHITPHIGGGVGEVLLDYLKFEKKNNHSVILLDQISREKKNQLINSQIKFDSNMYTKKKKIFSEIRKNDIVFVHWWNHPLLSDLIINFSWPNCRLIFWSHILGKYDPNSFTKKILNFPDYFIFTSPLSLGNNLLIKKNKSKYINICSTSKFNYENVSQKKEFLKVGYVGTFEFSKCKENLLDLLNIKSKKKYEIVLISNSKNKKLQKQINESILKDRIKVFYNINNQKVKEIMKTFNIFAYPLNKFHFGTNDLSLQQAIKLNIPQLVFNNPMEKWMTKISKGSLIARNDKDFKTKLKKLIDNNSLRKKLIGNLRKNKNKLFDFDNMVNELDRIYLKLSKQKKTKKKYNNKIKKKDKFKLYLETLNTRKAFIKKIISKNYFLDKNKVADDKKILSKEYNIWMSKTKSSPYHFQSFFCKDYKLKKLCYNLKKLNDK